MRLKNKTAIVTAAGAGIGRASALAFHSEGARVWAVDIDEAALRSLAGEAHGIETARLDVCDDKQVAEILSGIGPCDILFNCAGIVQGGTVLDADPAMFAAAFDINVISMVRTIRAVLPLCANVAPAPSSTCPRSHPASKARLGVAPMALPRPR